MARALVACALLAVAPAAHCADRVALVIGNGSYQSVSALANPTNDASDVSSSLKRLGFTVRVLENAGFDAMRRALIEFGRTARGAEMALVFFAGHGIEVGGENWLIPVDAELKSDIDAESEAIGLKTVMLAVSGARRLGLVILDACRNNPFAARMQRTVRTRSVDRGLARIEPSGSVLVAYAAKDGTTATDGAGRNSPFTAALLRHIETPGLEVNFLFRSVRDEVLAATRRAQEPFVYGSLSREAIYLKAGPAVAAAGRLPVGPRAEEIGWSLVRDSKEAEPLRRYVKEFPASPHRAEAEQRIAALTAQPPLPPLPAPAATLPEPRDRREIARSLQLELKRLGCFEGAVNGQLNSATREGLQGFARHAAVALPDEELSAETLKIIRLFEKRVCPLACRPGEKADGETCVRIVCPQGQVHKDGHCIQDPKVKPKPKPQSQSVSADRPSSGQACRLETRDECALRLRGTGLRGTGACQPERRQRIC